MGISYGGGRETKPPQTPKGTLRVVSEIHLNLKK